MNNIVKLDQSVINRIAAGEIIHHPYNAIKELMENSLDAGAKHIHVTLMAGGLELIKIKDDGCGIQLQDMPLVCERYATSKLTQFQDLCNLSTFGFRGEALASLSYVGKVTIVSKTADIPCAYRVSYEDGKMICKPKCCAGNKGTIIIIQNLFEGVPLRKKTLKTANEEFRRILDCIQKYAVHNANIEFTLLKSNSNKDVGLVGQSASSLIQRIQQIYGSVISSHVKFTKYQDSKWKFTLYFSNMTKDSFNDKTSAFIIFVNNRLVENAKIKKAIKQVYSDIKSNYKPPFIYICLDVKPSHVDVNIHPTKNQVHLLEEDKIISKLVIVLDQALNDLPETTKIKKQKNNAVLPKEATIDYYFKKAPQSSESGSTSSCIDTPPPSPRTKSLKKGDIKQYFQNLTLQKEKLLMETGQEMIAHDISSRLETLTPATSFPRRDTNHLKKSNFTATILQKNDGDFVEDLDSIYSIRQTIKDTEDKNISKLLAGHTPVGIIDDILSVIMYREKLYLINYPVISEEYIYQCVIQHFGKFGKLVFSQPISIESCLTLAADENAKASSVLLFSHKDLLQAYFKIELEQEQYCTNLKSLPMILKNYIPSLDKLPHFLLNLATKVDWDHEKNCLDAVARQLGLLYQCSNITEWDQVGKSLRQGELKAPKSIANLGYLVEIDLPKEVTINSQSY